MGVLKGTRTYMSDTSSGKSSPLSFTCGHLTVRRPGIAIKLAGEGSPRFVSAGAASLDEASRDAGGGVYDLPDTSLRLTHVLEIDRRAVTARLTVHNTGTEARFLSWISPFWCGEPLGGGVEWEGMPGGPPEGGEVRLVMIGQPEWMGGGGVVPVTGARRELDFWSCESYWYAGMSTGRDEPSLYAGIGSWANGQVRIRARSYLGVLSLALLADLSVDRSGTPLRLPPGGTFALRELRICTGETLTGAREEYFARLAETIGEANGTTDEVTTGKTSGATDGVTKSATTGETRRRPGPPAHRGGIFSGYSIASRPDHPQRDATPEFFRDILDWTREQGLEERGFDLFKMQFSRYSSGPAGKLPPTGDRPWPDRDAESIPDRVLTHGFITDFDLAERYPEGVQSVTDEVRRHGFTPALDSRPFLNLAGGSGEQDRIAGELYRRIAEEWGFDYLMFDFVSTDYESADDRVTMAEGIRSRFAAIRSALGPEVYLEACMCPLAPVLGIVDGFRPAEDWRPGAEGNIASEVACRLGPDGDLVDFDLEYMDPSPRPACWDAWSNRSWQSRRRARTAMTLYGTLGYRALLGGFLREIGEDRLNELLAIMPPDGVAAQPVDYPSCDPPRIWTKRRHFSFGEREFLALFNWDTDRAREIAVPAETLFPEGSHGRVVWLYSFWDQKLIRLLSGEESSFTVRLESCEAAGLLITRVLDVTVPHYLGSSAHLTGAAGITELRFDPEELQLHMTLESEGRRQVDLYLSRPERLVPKLTETEGCEVEIVDSDAVRLRVVRDDRVTRRITVPFMSGAYVV